MNLGNFPKTRNEVEIGRRYWRLSIGRRVMPDRFFEGGWHGFEFVILKPVQFPLEGEAIPFTFRFAFAYWLPIYLL